MEAAYTKFVIVESNGILKSIAESIAIQKVLEESIEIIIDKGNDIVRSKKSRFFCFEL